MAKINASKRINRTKYISSKTATKYLQGIGLDAVTEKCKIINFDKTCTQF